MSTHAKLSKLSAVDLFVKAEQISEAFHDYSLSSRAHANNSSLGEKQAWCETVGRQAHDLLLTLGYIADRGSLMKENVLNAKTILSAYWPGEGTVTESLEYFVRRFAPGEMGKSGRISAHHNDLSEFFGGRINCQPKSREDSTKDAWSTFMSERLPHGLQMLETLARLGADGHGRGIKLGGSNANHARRHLFIRLADVYRDLFGRLPSVSHTRPVGYRETTPSGKSIEWHQALLKLVAERARICSPELTERSPVSAINLQLELSPIQGLFIDASTSVASDKLANWIRGGVRDLSHWEAGI